MANGSKTNASNPSSNRSIESPRRQVTAQVMRDRTKAFALRVIRLVDSLPNRLSAQTLGKQVLRSGTSVGANYRSACRARSRPDFISKMGIVEEEADESIYWFELLVESGLVQKRLLQNLMNEADEILAITVSSIRTARRKLKRTMAK